MGVDEGREALTPWLADLLDRLSGKSDREKPLTFGDLWGPGGSQAPLVNLEMVTTNLTFGRPYRLPFEIGAFCFDPAEFRRLFPERIVKHLESRSKPNGEIRGPAGQVLLRLPEPADIPVVVAVRMSLSFPLLLSAVPLHIEDYSEVPTSGQTPRPCWFSDGGISSNFPIHFFDAPLPRWPTFAINLRPVHSSQAEAGVWMPSSNKSGIIEWRTEIDQTPGAVGILAFLGSILSAMQNWSDNMQTRLPGYRDRIAHVSLTADEGGLNLNMPHSRITDLSERGAKAGRTLAERFSSPSTVPGLDWNNHRWVRFLTALSCLEEWLTDFERGWSSTDPSGTYQDIVAGTAPDQPTSYATASGSRSDAIKLVGDLLAVLHGWQGSGRGRAIPRPKPSPLLRMRPRF
jgi:hypothetical protein